jgi:hypothetical protein
VCLAKQLKRGIRAKNFHVAGLTGFVLVQRPERAFFLRCLSPSPTDIHNPAPLAAPGFFFEGGLFLG